MRSFDRVRNASASRRVIKALPFRSSTSTLTSDLISAVTLSKRVLRRDKCLRVDFDSMPAAYWSALKYERSREDSLGRSANRSFAPLSVRPVGADNGAPVWVGIPVMTLKNHDKVSGHAGYVHLCAFICESTVLIMCCNTTCYLECISGRDSQFFKENQVLVAEDHLIHFGNGVAREVKETAIFRSINNKHSKNACYNFIKDCMPTSAGPCHWKHFQISLGCPCWPSSWNLAVTQWVRDTVPIICVLHLQLYMSSCNKTKQTKHKPHQ